MDTQHTPQREWEDFVGKAIDDLKIKHPTLNLSQIAMKINLNRSTLTRIINEGIKPQLDNYIKIIMGSGNGDIINEALAAYDKTLSNQSESIFKVAKSEKGHLFTSVEMERILDDEDRFVAYILSSKENGTSTSEICHVLGNKGIATLNELVQTGLVKEENGKYKKISNHNVLIRSFDSIKRHIPTYSKYYKPEHVGKKRNYIHSLTAGLNNDAIEQVQDLHRKFHENLLLILRDPKNAGDNTMFSVAFCDTFNSIDYLASNQGFLQ